VHVPMQGAATARTDQAEDSERSFGRHPLPDRTGNRRVAGLSSPPGRTFVASWADEVPATVGGITSTVHRPHGVTVPWTRAAITRRPRHVLAAVELVTGAAALVGGLLLAAAPDGSLLRADPAVLAGSPFADYRWPGVLLATLVGGGYLLTGWWTWRSGFAARTLSLFAGVGLVVFEASELLWLGFQPLEAVFAVVGAVVAVLAVLAPRTPTSAATGAKVPHLREGSGGCARLPGDPS
jgi:hypothetical protein